MSQSAVKKPKLAGAKHSRDAEDVAATATSAVAAPNLSEEESKEAAAEVAHLKAALIRAQAKYETARRLHSEANACNVNRKDDEKAFCEALLAADEELDEAQQAVGRRQILDDLKDGAFLAAMTDANSKDGNYRAFAWFLRTWKTYATTTKLRQDIRAEGNRSVLQMLEAFCVDAMEAGIKDVPIVSELLNAEGDDEDGGSKPDGAKTSSDS